MENVNKKIIEKVSDGTLTVGKDDKIQPKSGRSFAGSIGQTSEVINELTKRVIEQDLNTANQRYFTQIWFPRRFVANGLLDKDYEVKVAPAGTADPLADMTIADLEKGDEIVARETFELIVDDVDAADWHIYDSQAQDFATNSSRGLAILRLQANSRNRKFGKKLQAKILKTITDNITETISLPTDIAEASKVIWDTFYKYGTENDTVINDTINGVSYGFDNTFEQNDFYLLLNKDFASSWKVDFKRNSFNYGGQEYQVAGIQIKDFSVLIGTSADLQKYQALLIPKKAIDVLAHYDASKVVATTRMYTKGWDYAKQNAFKVKGQPIIAFETAAKK